MLCQRRSPCVPRAAARALPHPMRRVPIPPAGLRIGASESARRALSRDRVRRPGAPTSTRAAHARRAVHVVARGIGGTKAIPWGTKRHSPSTFASTLLSLASRSNASGESADGPWTKPDMKVDVVTGGTQGTRAVGALAAVSGRDEENPHLRRAAGLTGTVGGAPIENSSTAVVPARATSHAFAPRQMPAMTNGIDTCAAIQNRSN